jgi:hypothetical protein
VCGGGSSHGFGAGGLLQRRSAPDAGHQRTRQRHARDDGEKAKSHEGILTGGVTVPISTVTEM